MDEWLQTDAAGSLRRFGSLGALAAMSDDERHSCTDLNAGEALVVGDAPDKENQAPDDN